MNLSAKEEKIVQFIADGYSNKAIAPHVGLARETIRFYVSQMMKRNNCKNRTELAVRYERLHRASAKESTK